MSTLKLRLEGPMQSWGTYSRFTERDTGKEPSKSGVIGLLCAALGRPREADISDLVSLEMAVRVDREGKFAKDYHTVLEVPKANRAEPETSVSNRYYLADASFLVLLEGDDKLLKDLAFALEAPKWTLCLGRKAFAPSTRVLLGISMTETMDQAIRSTPWFGRKEDWAESLRSILECSFGEGEARMDVPISFAQRKFGIRYVRQEWIPNPEPNPAKDVKEAK